MLCGVRENDMHVPPHTPHVSQIPRRHGRLVPAVHPPSSALTPQSMCGRSASASSSGWQNGAAAAPTAEGAAQLPLCAAGVGTTQAPQHPAVLRLMPPPSTPGVSEAAFLEGCAAAAVVVPALAATCGAAMAAACFASLAAATLAGQAVLGGSSSGQAAAAAGTSWGPFTV